MTHTAQRSAVVRTVASREIFVKLRDKGFIASTLVFLVIIAAAVALPALLAGGTPEYRMAHTEDAREIADAAVTLGGESQGGLFGTPEADIELVAAADADEARAMVSDEEVQAALVVVDGELTLLGRQSVPDDLETLVTSASQSVTVGEVARDAGLTQDQVQAITAPTPPVVSLSDAQPDYAIPPVLLTVVFGFLFYFSVLTFGMSIAQSVVEEKQSRVVELLVAAVPIRWLLAGKVLGNALMAFGQVALIVMVGVLGALLTDASEIVNEVVAASGWFLPFFVLGFLMLACLWAVAGSLASRIEDLQNTTVIMQIAVMLPFFSAVFITEPSLLQRVLSYFPLTAPLMMPARVVADTAAPWEPWVAMALVLITAALLVMVGARLYAGSVLNMGNRTRLSTAWRKGSVNA